MKKNKSKKAESSLKIPISEAEKPEKELKKPVFEPKNTEKPWKFTFKLSILSAPDMKDRISVAEYGDYHITASLDGMHWVNMTQKLYEYSVCVDDIVKINALQEAYRQLPEHPYQYPPYVLYKEWADKDGSAGRKDPKPDMTHEVWLGAGKKELKTHINDQEIPENGLESVINLPEDKEVSDSTPPKYTFKLNMHHVTVKRDGESLDCKVYIVADNGTHGIGTTSSSNNWYLCTLDGREVLLIRLKYAEIIEYCAFLRTLPLPWKYPILRLYKHWLKKIGSTLRKLTWDQALDRFNKGDLVLVEKPNGDAIYEPAPAVNLPDIEPAKDVDTGCIDPGRRDVSMKSILLSRIGSRICEQRKKKGMTQEGLANALGTTQAVISRMENGSHDMSTADLYGISMYFNEPLQYLTDEFPAPVGENVWIMDKEKKFFHKYRIIGCSPDDTAFRSLFVVPVIITPYLVFESWGEETRSEVKLDYSNISCIPLSGLSMSKSNPGDYVLNIETETPVSIHTIGSCDPSLS